LPLKYIKAINPSALAFCSCFQEKWVKRKKSKSPGEYVNSHWKIIFR